MINLNMQMINTRKNMLDAFLYEKNGFEIWINVVEYGKNASYILLIYIFCQRKNENP
jgi:hypothetical protein